MVWLKTCSAVATLGMSSGILDFGGTFSLADGIVDLSNKLVNIVSKELLCVLVEGEKNLPVILVDVFKTFIEVVNNLSGQVVSRCLHFCQRWSEGQWNRK